MANRYESGPRKTVAKNLVFYATRDIKALIESITPSYGEPSDEDKKHIQEYKAMIRDFRRLGNTLSKG